MRGSFFYPLKGSVFAWSGAGGVPGVHSTTGDGRQVIDLYLRRRK